MLRVLQVQLIQQNISVEHKDNSLGNYVCHIHLRFVLLPTVVFWALESEWTLAASFYFVFISLTTIGLGDLVPGEAATKLSVNKDIYQISVASECPTLIFIHGCI